MEQTKKNTWGGARPGGGRPKGAVTRLTAREILDTADAMLGKPLIVSILEGYMESIAAKDSKERIAYEKFLLDKTASTAIEAEVTNHIGSIEAKQEAFRIAIANLTKSKSENET